MVLVVEVLDDDGLPNESRKASKRASGMVTILESQRGVDETAVLHFSITMSWRRRAHDVELGLSLVEPVGSNTRRTPSWPTTWTYGGLPSDKYRSSLAIYFRAFC